MLIEGLGSATIVNGIMRIETFTRNSRGEDVTAGDLLIPVNRVEAVADGLKKLLEKAQEAAKQSAASQETH